MGADVVIDVSTGAGRGQREIAVPPAAPTLTARLDQARARVARARQGDDPAALVARLLTVATCAFDSGELAVADAALGQATALFDEPGLAGSPARPIVAAQQAVLASRRGRWDEVEPALAQALAWAPATTPASLTVVRALRAEALVEHDPAQAVHDARLVREALGDGGDPWAHRMRRVEVEAALAQGDTAAAAAALATLVTGTDLDTTLGRARSTVLVGQVALARGEAQGGAATLAEAVFELDRAHARYDLVRALLAWAQADPAIAPVALARACRSSDDDPAYERLWASRATLQVRVLGGPPFALGDRPLTFISRRALVLAMFLALRGPDGASRLALGELLWPGATPKAARPRLRTTVWEVRRVLGDEGWRMRATRERLVLDLRGAAFDLDEAVAHGDRQVGPAGPDGGDGQRWPFAEWAGVLDIELARALSVRGGIRDTA